MRITFVIAGGVRGTALTGGTGADPAPLVAAIEEWAAEVAAILRTHAHHNHVVPEDELRERYGVEVIAMSAVGIPEPKECEAAVQVATMCGVARNSLRMMRLRTSARRRSQSVADNSIVVARRAADRRVVALSACAYRGRTDRAVQLSYGPPPTYGGHGGCGTPDRLMPAQPVTAQCQNKRHGLDSLRCRIPVTRGCRPDCLGERS